MRRFDRYERGFDPNDIDAGHVEFHVSPEVHQVALSGTHLEARLIVDALKHFYAGLQQAELIGQNPEHMEEVAGLITTLVRPNFTGDDLINQAMETLADSTGPAARAQQPSPTGITA